MSISAEESQTEPMRSDPVQARAARIYDAADAFEESMSPARLFAFIGEFFGAIGDWLTLRR